MITNCNSSPPTDPSPNFLCQAIYKTSVTTAHSDGSTSPSFLLDRLLSGQHYLDVLNLVQLASVLGGLAGKGGGPLISEMLLPVAKWAAEGGVRGLLQSGESE